MKRIYFIIVLLMILACSTNIDSTKKEIKEAKPPIKQTRPELQQIMDSANVIGSVLVFDLSENIYYSNDFKRCKKGFLPASTFKIPNSIIGLETGVINEFTVFKWDGKKRRLPVWEQDLTFKDAFQVSCVPCYQEVARKIGVKRMNNYLKKLKYGNMIVDSSNIDLFWLEGESKISQFEQIDFLQRFYNSVLPISENTVKIMKNMMLIDSIGEYKISGKTGWAIRNNNNIGWFVGYLETSAKVYFIATNIEPKEKFNMDMFPKTRSEISLGAFRKLGIIR